MSIGNYASYGIVNGDNYVFGGIYSIGSKESTYGNPNLSWEKTSQVNLGLEIGLLNWLNVEVDVYKGMTSDMLLNVPVMEASGFSTILQNIGKVENKGLEILIRATPIQTEKFTWNTNVSYSTNSNKVVALSSEKFSMDQDYFYTGYTGEPINHYPYRPSRQAYRYFLWFEIG